MGSSAKHFIQCFQRKERESSCNHAMQSTQKSSSLLRDVKSAEGAARPPLNPRTASCDSLMRRPSKRRCIASFSPAALGSVASAEPWVAVDSTVTTTACVTIAAPKKVAVQAKPTMSLSAPPSTGPAPHLFIILSNTMSGQISGAASFWARLGSGLLNAIRRLQEAPLAQV